MRTFPLSSAPRAVDALLSPARRVTLYGPRASSLSLHYAAETACEERTVVYICGDNRFDSYVIARLARQFHHRREDALNRILVARAFTGFQFNELIQRLKPNEVAGPVIVSGICSTFMDEDLPHNDAARLFYRVLWRLAELADRGMSFLLVESQEIAGARRAHFLNDLYKASNFIFRLDGERTYTLEMRSYRPLYQLASMERQQLT
ncbi:MAG: hypothetical protein L0Y75_06330 [Acidobacteria bacterium]|nr:hypothetical protein [Acidobacteriota bacterium]